MCACYIVHLWMVFSQWCISCWHLDKCLPSRADLPFMLNQDRTTPNGGTLHCVCGLLPCCRHLSCDLNAKCSACVHLPEANNRTLLADVTLGLMFCCLCCSHSVQNREPNHRLGLQAHPIHKLSRVQLHLISYLRGVKRGRERLRSSCWLWHSYKLINCSMRRKQQR